MHLGGCCDVMGGGAVGMMGGNGVGANGMAVPAPLPNGTATSTDEGMMMYVYPAPMGIAPTAAGRNGAMFFCFIILGGTLFSSILNIIAGSRFIYSFARDGGFPPPFSAIFRYVEPTTQAPLGAILMNLLGGLLFTVSWTNKSPQVAFSAVSGINAIGFLMVYGTPSLLRITSALSFFKPAKEFSLGRLSIPIAFMGMLYGLFSVGTISMPNLYPIKGHPNNVNYAPIAFAATLVFSIVLYPVAIFLPAWGYKGPALVAQATRHKARPTSHVPRGGCGGRVGPPAWVGGSCRGR